MDVKKLKKTWKKIWYFIWESDSIWSWIVNIILAFIIIKFIVYPGLGFLLSTSHPIVAVVSGSMEHKIVEDNSGILRLCDKTYTKKGYINFDKFWDACGEWYEEEGITKSQFSKFSFKNGFSKGDIIILKGRKPKDIKTGDIIVFKSSRPDPIIHRVIKKWQKDGEYYFHTKGDHNRDSIQFETNIDEDQLIGKALFPIPYLGYIKIWFVNLIKLFVG